MKLRVCHLISGDLWAGAEKVTDELLGALAERGVDVTAGVFCRGRLFEQLRSRGLRTVLIDEQTHSFFGMVRLASTLGRFQIVHTHRYKENLLGALVRRRLGAEAHFCTLHSWPFGLPGYSLQAKLITLLTARFLTHRTVAVSRDIASRLGRYLPQEKILQIDNGLTIGPEPTTIPGTSPDALRLGVVGRLVRIKGYDLLLHALARLDARTLDRIDGVDFFGEGPEQDPLARLARELGLEDKVCFRGFVTSQDEIYGRMDIFVMPSLHEGMPMALIEAMARRKIIVASRAGGIRELIDEGESGLLFSAGDAGDLCARLEEAVNGLEQSIEMGRRARQRAVDRCDVRKQAARLIQAYDEVLAGGGST